MSDQTFTPAMGRFAPTRLYDPVVALTRERLWRALAVMYAAPRPDDVIVDVGCGTGSLALLLSRVEPRAQIIGVDPDSDVLAVARQKAAGCSAVQWRIGMGDALVDSVGADSADTA
jgi:ubiquinone/menaquinone biosynthesis C-methylase UbiE